MKLIRLLLSIAFGCVCLSALAGCDRAETPPPEPKVVRKKIAPPPESLARAPVPAETSEAADSPSEPSTADSEPPPDALARADTEAGPSEEAAPEGPDASSEGEEAGASESDPERPSDDVADMTAPVEADAPAQGEEAETAAASDAAAEAPGEGESADSEPLEMSPAPPDSDAEPGALLAAYDPGDRVDPFEPLFREEPDRKQEEEVEVEETAASEKPKRRLTPLEKLDLGQLKLVGIIRAPSGDRALVEEASGKGYIITRGTYIGIHSGQVVEIREDGIIVEEKHEDVYGDMNVRRRELKFQRPSGDEIL